MKTIDKEDLVEFIENEYEVTWENGYLGGMKDACVDILNKIESMPVEETGWILCSEMLPEEETDVLVTRKFLGCKDGSNGWNNHIPPTTYVEVAQYSNGEWTALSDEYKIARSRHTDPIAWKPLPDPLKGECE